MSTSLLIVLSVAEAVVLVVVLALALIIATVAGMAQARRMTRLRHRAVSEPRDPRLLALIDRGARQALILRASIGTLTLALLGLGVVLAA